eukprot:g34813.t1
MSPLKIAGATSELRLRLFDLSINSKNSRKRTKEGGILALKSPITNHDTVLESHTGTQPSRLQKALNITEITTDYIKMTKNEMHVASQIQLKRTYQFLSMIH